MIPGSLISPISKSNGVGIRLVGIGSVSGTGSGGGSLTIDLTNLTGGIDTTARTGDIVVISQGWSGLTIFSNAVFSPTTSGYTNLVSRIVGSDNQTARRSDMGLSYKIMGVTPDTIVTIPHYDVSGNSNADTNMGVVMVFRGVDLVTPIDVTRTTATGSDTLISNPAAITPVTEGSAIITMSMIAHNLSGSLSFTSITDYDYFGYVSTNNSSYDLSSAFGYYLNDTAAPTDPAVNTPSTNSGDGAWASTTVALRPAI